jgi:Icc-related predicted phosphoesterase
MRLWILSDLHLERRLAWQPTRPENFDVLVVAGDVDDDLPRAIECVALIADGKPAVYVAGNHEVTEAANDPVLASAAGVIAEEYGVTWLECTTAEIGGLRFAGATLWEPGDPLYAPSVVALAAARADLIVTHYPPIPTSLMRSLPVGGLWIHGHHHGYADVTAGGRRFVRNALGYPDEPVARPAIPDLVIEL